MRVRIYWVYNLTQKAGFLKRLWQIRNEVEFGFENFKNDRRSIFEKVIYVSGRIKIFPCYPGRDFFIWDDHGVADVLSSSAGGKIVHEDFKMTFDPLKKYHKKILKKRGTKMALFSPYYREIKSADRMADFPFAFTDES